MTITYDLDLDSFNAWSGAVDTLDRIQREGKCEELENILEDLYPDGMTETQLNDLLWFDSEQVYEWLGIRSEEQIRKEIKEAEDELADIQSDLEDELDDEDLTTEERAEIIDGYQPDIDEPKERTVYLESEASKMVDYTRINVSKDGKYLFATEQGQLTYDWEAKRVYKLLKEKFPENEGYKVSVIEWRARGIEPDWAKEVNDNENNN